MSKFEKKEDGEVEFVVPLPDEEPSEELIEWLNAEYEGEWSGDEEGLVFHVEGLEEPLYAWPGDTVRANASGVREVEHVRR